MNPRIMTIGALACALTISTAQAQVWPQNVGPMHHILINFDGTDITLDAPDLDEPLPLRNFGETLNPPANVLEGKAYNDQYGWLANGIFSPPSEPIQTAFWIRVVSQSPGLETYQGGMRPITPNHTFAPIFETDGAPDIWQWNGTMTHNWYAAAQPGDYTATYEVYVGDLAGTPVSGFGSDTVTFTWRYVPEPAAAVLLCAGLVPFTITRLASARRRA